LKKERKKNEKSKKKERNPKDRKSHTLAALARARAPLI
jgi:hypothetical protein